MKSLERAVHGRMSHVGQDLSCRSSVFGRTGPALRRRVRRLASGIGFNVAAISLFALAPIACGTSELPKAALAPDAKSRIVGDWEATDGSGVILHFDGRGRLGIEVQGKTLADKGEYRFVDARKVEVVGDNFLVTINGRPLPMAFTVDFENDGKEIVLRPGPDRELMMQFSLFGNGKFHVFPPEKDLARYLKRD